jgi:regulator of protease activity HflC (stomatin/prohibitin superfamily)
MNVMEQVIDVPEQEIITKDNASVAVDGIALFQVFDAAKASYEISSLEPAIVELTTTNIRSVMGTMDLDEMLSHRDEINERLLRVVDAAVSPWGIKVNRIEIKNIVPPADLIQSMGRQMKAECDKRAEILTAEGQRPFAILRAEGAKQAQILEAEGRREAALPDVEARERSAKAEATEVVSDAIAKGEVASINYFIADKYLRALTEIVRSSNQKVLMFPIETSTVLGALGSIAEIVNATFGGTSSSTRESASPRPTVLALTRNPRAKEFQCWRSSPRSIRRPTTKTRGALPTATDAGSLQAPAEMVTSRDCPGAIPSCAGAIDYLDKARFINGRTSRSRHSPHNRGRHHSHCTHRNGRNRRSRDNHRTHCRRRSHRDSRDHIPDNTTCDSSHHPDQTQWSLQESPPSALRKSRPT